jgi:C4-type Zn-finger protein
MVMEKYCLLIEVEVRNEFLAKSILKTVEGALDKAYQNIDLKTKIIKKQDTSKWLEFLEQIKSNNI